MKLLTHQILSILLFFIGSTLMQSQVKNIGLPEIRNYKRTDYKGGTQNWNIDQDSNGNLYFANNSGLFQFDGANWSKYTFPYPTVIRDVKIDKSGKIFVSGYQEFGYFLANSNGKLVYHSLAKFLLKKNKVNDIIWKIHINNGEVIFQGFEKAYVYKNNKIKIIVPFSRFQFSFQIENKIYFQDITKGLLEYKDGKLFILEDTTKLNDTEVWGIFAMPENKLLITTLDKGLFIYGNNKLIPWDTEANSFIKKNSGLGGVTINKKNIALNSVLDGIIICDQEGKIIQHINQKKGLQNNTVLTSYVDHKNNLWLGLDNGIAFVNENSPYSYFGSTYGLSSVYASAIFKGNLYVATNQGVFYHSWNIPFKESEFKLVEGTTGQAWNIQIIDNELICSHNRGAFIIEGEKLQKPLDNIGYWIFKKIPNHPNYMIGSNYSGFSIFEKKSNRWQYVNQIKGYSRSVGDFEINNNTIWVKKDELIYQFILDTNFKKFKNIKIHKSLSKMDQGITSIQRIRNSIYFQTNNHFYKYSERSKQFYKDTIVNQLFKNIPKTNTIYEDEIGNIWYINKESLNILMKNKKGGYTNTVAPFFNLTQQLVYNKLSINTLDPENIFIGLTDGLIHYNSKSTNEYISKPKVYVRSFVFANDTIYFGNNGNKIGKLKIPYKFNNEKFSFSTPTYENVENIKYSYKLTGFDDKWSTWSQAAQKEYTNLREGNYVMNVKAMNSYGQQSDAASVAFTVSPPWYRHFLAFLFYVVVILAVVYYTQIRIKSKIRKNKYYEKIEQRRLYLEKESKIRQEQLELEQKIEKLETEKLKTQILVKDKELVTNSLQVVKKNKILNGIIKKIKDIDVEALDESTKFQFTKINKSIVKEVNADHSWKDLEKHIKNVHFDFLKRLKTKHPKISPRELDLSTYLLMNMSTKEIAEIMNISTGGVELARYRLRKKLELNKKENLTGYLMSI